jgi:hypothetical protein
MPEWTNGPGLGPGGLVPSEVRILFPAYKTKKAQKQKALQNGERISAKQCKNNKK